MAKKGNLLFNYWVKHVGPKMERAFDLETQFLSCSKCVKVSLTILTTQA